MIVSLLIKDDIFSLKLGYGKKNIKCADFFYNKTSEIILGISIKKYLYIIYGNWKAAQTQGLIIYKKNMIIVVIVVAEKKAHLEKKSNNDL